MKITFEFATQDDCLDRMVPSDLRVLVAQRDRLQALVAELYDLIKYAQVDSGVCMCGDYIKNHNQSSGHMPLNIWDHAVEQINKEGSSEAFILRKQAEALCQAKCHYALIARIPDGTASVSFQEGFDSAKKEIEDALERYAQKLHDEADAVGAKP
jgi:hypothetical protein